MANPRIVMGTGPDALRAAAALAHVGQPVLLLQAVSTETGLDHPEIPEGTGRLNVNGTNRQFVEAVLGSLVEGPAPTRALQVRGRRLSLPLSPQEIRHLFEPNVVMGAGLAWSRKRMGNAVAQIIGGGSEERSYRDWVVRRMGEPALEQVYASYAERRWGTVVDALSCSVARLHHGRNEVGDHQVVGGSPADALRHSARVIRDNGGEIRTDVEVEALRVEDGRVVAVVLADEELTVDEPVWIARAPNVVGQWLGEAISPSLHTDLANLRMATSVQIALKGDTTQLPEEVHVLDPGAPFFRVMHAYGVEGAAVFHATDSDAAPAHSDDRRVADFVHAAAELGIGTFSAEGARVERIAERQPLWTTGCHSRLRRVLNAWCDLGIVATGRSGNFSFLDPGAELALCAVYLDQTVPDQREYHRAHLDPPVRVDDLDARISCFIGG